MSPKVNRPMLECLDSEDGCGLTLPLRRFDRWRTKAVRKGSLSHRVVDGWYYRPICRRCVGENRDRAREQEPFRFKARTWIDDHRAKFVKRGFLPAFTELPKRDRPAAQREYLGMHYNLTEETLAILFERAWTEKCPGHCDWRFQDMQHGHRSMTADWMDREKGPYLNLDHPQFSNITALCDSENAQKGERTWDEWQEDWYWDRLWIEARRNADARRVSLPERMLIALGMKRKRRASPEQPSLLDDSVA